MKTFIKILIGSISFIVIVALALFIVLINIDLNNHKDTISKKIRQMTGYHLTLAGDIQHTLYPWLSIAAEDITIDGAAPDAPPMLSAAALKIRIKLLPLLSRRIEIDTLHIRGVDLRLKKEELQRTDWQQQEALIMPWQGKQLPTKNARKPDPDRLEKTSLPVRGLALGGVEMQDITVHWIDQRHDRRLILDKVYLHVDTLAYEQPIKLAAAARVALNQPHINGMIKIAGLIRYTDAGSHITIEPLTVNIDSDTLPADARPISVKTALSLDLKNSSATLPEIHLNALNSTLSGELQITRLHSMPALSTTLAVSSADVVPLFKLAGMGSVADQLIDLPDKKLKINTKIDTDSAKNEIDIKSFRLDLAGADIDITTHIQGNGTDIPVVDGRLAAHIPDLPLLMTIAGALKGADSRLSSQAKRLASLDKKSLTLATQFDIDIKNNKIDIPGIQLDALGLRLTGSIQGGDDTKGELSGDLRFTSATALKPLLVALDQPWLGQLLESVDMTAKVQGKLPRLGLRPLTLNAQLAERDDLQTPPDTVRLDANLTLDLSKQTLDITPLSITGLGANINGNLMQQIDKPAFSGSLSMTAVNLRALADKLNMPLPLTDSTALNKVALNSLTFHGTDQRLTIESLEAILDDALIQGKFSVDDFKRPAYRFGLNIDTLDIDRYLPAQSEGRPITPETAVTGAATKLPTTVLRSLNIKGDVDISQLSFSGIKIQDAQMHIDAKEGQIKLDPVAARLYDGHYRAAVMLDARDKETRLDINTNLSDMDLGLLLADLVGYKNLTGKGELSLSLKAQGNDVNKLKNRLSGHGKIELKKGGLKGFDATNIVQQIKAMYKSGRIIELDKGEQTEFGSLTGTVAIDRGKIHVDDLSIQTSGLISINGSGMLFNLNDETWDYDFKINAADATQLLIKCNGKLVQKRCLPNIEDTAEKLLKDKLKEKIDRLKIKIPAIRLKDL